MDRTALIAACRRVLGDKVAPYLWDDDTITDKLADAEEEACLRMAARKTPLLIDDSTALSQVAMTAGDGWKSLDYRILAVVGALFGGKRLDLTTVSELDAYFSNWEASSGTPEAYLVQDGRVRLYRKPEADGTLQLEVWRLPTNRLSESSPTPEIDASLHSKLVDYVAESLYMDNDSEKYDPEISNRHAQRFASNFGPPVSTTTVQALKTQSPRRARFPRG